MSVTVETIISPAAEKRLVLNASQWAASLVIGSSWDRLRVGCRMAVGDSGGALGSTPRFYLGMCSDPVSGFTNGPLSGASTKHYVGTLSLDTNWSRIASSPNYYANGSFQQMGKKVGVTETSYGGVSTTLIVAEPTVARRIYMFEILKGSPNYTLSVSINPAITDHTQSNLLAAMEESDFNTACIAAGLSSSISTVVSTIDEPTDGDLNAICCGWSTAVVDCHVSEMLFAKFA